MSKSLCFLAFETLQNKLLGLTYSNYEKLDKLKLKASNLPKRAPLFITWTKDGVLRGCIGTFMDQDIIGGVKKFSIASSMEDPRFPPVLKSELTSLSVSVTLLTNFEDIKNWDEWVIGKHGLKISLQAHGRHYLGTFLPSVAVEQDWDKPTTLWYLLQKAGLYQVSKSEVVEYYKQALESESLELVRYEGRKDSMDYSEYEHIMHSCGSKEI